MDTYKKLREMADKNFEMPQSMAKTASYYILQAYKVFEENKSKNAKRKA